MESVKLIQMILLDERLKNELLPQTLFHYTDSKGLLGILDRNCLCATSARYLNESSEYSYGLKRNANALKEAAANTSSLSEQASLDGILILSRNFQGSASHLLLPIEKLT